MFTKVKLTNFRKHVSRSFEFGKGLNVIRGANEAAKTTIVEAITYALFGANSLRESLEKTVTWNVPVRALAVELEFVINQQAYRVTRSSAGAEMFSGTTLTVTGQREVTKYCETLLGATADATTKLMMASQSSLRGALADGPAAAVTLIESLANFDLIDSIVSLVQEKLPSGNTIALQSQIEVLDAQIKEPLVDERGPAQQALSEALNQAADADIASARTKAAEAAQRPEWERNQALTRAVVAAEAAVTSASRASITAFERIGTAPEPVDVSSIPALELAIQQGGKRAVAVGLHNQLTSLWSVDEWEGTAETLAAEITQLTQLKDTTLARVAAAKQEIADQRLNLTVATAKLITATHCAFCDKDLSDVPEVAAFNATWTPKVIAAKATITKAECDVSESSAPLAELTSDIKALTAVQNLAAGRVSLYQKAAGYIQLDENFVPARWAWIGPDLSLPIDAKADQKLTTLRAAITNYEREVGRHQEARQHAFEAEKVLASALAALEPCRAAAEGCETVFLAYDAAVVLAGQDLRAQTVAEQIAKDAAQAAGYAEKLHQGKLASRNKLVEQQVLAVSTLKATVFNNALLKKLRTAKPQVANKLWAVVLGTVSHTFSAIRGQASVVTRAPEGFLVDGKSVGGLSGSTLDALGLAIRIALTKTFLPNTRFMVLDEASAACDTEREAAMVGAVVSADFDQVVWVTHSDAVEAFAANLIEL